MNDADRGAAPDTQDDGLSHRAMLQLLQALDDSGYDFVAPTPATQAAFCARRSFAKDLRDVFGWSLPFSRDLVDPELTLALEEAGLLGHQGEGLCSRVRVSRLAGRLFLHSAYPTNDKDAVFLGPDSYRFARLIRDRLKNGPAPRRILDLGAGAGVGGLVAGALYPEAEVVLTDVNRKALRFANANAAFSKRTVTIVAADAGAHEFNGVELALTNPPFMLDSGERAYRNGGGMHGAQLSLDWTLHTASRLAPGGRMILYTGSAIVDGRDRLLTTLKAELPRLGCALDYEELDPDIFGEELTQSSYLGVERIAAVGALITRTA